MALKTIKATVNGQTLDMTYNASTGRYEAEFVAPTSSTKSADVPLGYFPVEIEAVDTALNKTTVNDETPTLGTSLRLQVVEKNKPTVSELVPSSGSFIKTNKPTITFRLLDNVSQASGYSGIDTSKTVLKVNGDTVPTSKITFTACAGGYDCSYTPTDALPNGTTTVSVTATDRDGNVSTAVASSFKIDTVPPTLSVSPEDGYETNNNILVVTGTTNDATSSPVAIAVLLNNVDQGAVTVQSDGKFSKSVTLTNQGDNIITVTATDSAGQTTTITRTIKFNTTAPVIKDVIIDKNPADAGTSYKISCVVECV